LDPAWLAEVSTESLACSEALAVAALRHTPEAQFSLAITGDLDPSAAPTKQGRVFLAAAYRESRDVLSKIESLEVSLQATDRINRQTEAAAWVLEFGIKNIEHRVPR